METVTDPITPDDIDLEFTAEVVADLEVMTVGDERVVIGGPTQLVVLNPIAALILQFLDGKSSLGELVDDLADALAVDREVVEDDVLAFVRVLGANGLLVGVALAEPELGDWPGFEPAPVLEPGDGLDDFTLPDLDGTERSLSGFHGKRALLVNWSPACGFCVNIAAELGALRPLLDERAVELVFIAMGEVDDNRAVFAGAGVDTPTLLRRDGTDVDPFAGTGTPAAYLLDEDGRLVEHMAVGADQVPTLARDLAGVDPAVPYGTTAETVGDDVAADDGRGQYLPAPGAMCGPGGGGSASNSTDWKGTRAYALGDYHVGLRYDGPETADVLDVLFAGARVNDRRVPDNYSVALGGPPTTKRPGASQSLKLLVHGGTQLVRSRSTARVLAGLLQYLSADLDAADPSLTRVNATAVVHDGHASLLPAGLVDFVKHLQPRLARAGMCIVDTPRTLLDIEARELVVAEPTVPFDASVLEAVDAGVKLGSELPWVRPGRYALRSWFLTRGPEHLGALSPAIAVTAALPTLFDMGDLTAQVARLADLFADVSPYGLWYENGDQLVDQVRHVLEDEDAPRPRTRTD